MKPGAALSEGRVVVSVLLALFFAAHLCAPSPGAAQDPGTVLVLHSYHSEMDWTRDIAASLEQTLRADDPPVQVISEFMDVRRFPGGEHYSLLEALLTYKARRYEPDIIIASDTDALQFVLKHRTSVFHDVPVVFCGVNNFNDSMLDGQSGVTGVDESPSLRETLQVARRLDPKVQEVVFIGGSTMPTDRANRDLLLRTMAAFKGTLRFRLWLDMPDREIFSRVAELGPGQVVVLTRTLHDADGQLMDFPESSEALSAACPVPMYGLWDFFSGHGVVGGKVVSAERQGKRAGEIALRILRGESPDAIPVLRTSANRHVYDYEQLKRFDLDPARLPRDAIVLNRPSLLYALNKWYVWTGAGLIGLLFLLILFLLGNIRVRKMAEARLLQSTRDLQQAKDAAEAAARAKEEFLANVSHEIRTPLNGILGMTELSLGSGVSGELRTYLDMIRQSGQNLLTIINDILDFSKMESGRMTLEMHSFDLEQLVESVIQLFSYQGEQKGVSVRARMSDGMPRRVAGDPARLRQILINLVGNGLKFTDSGKVEVLVFSEDQLFPEARHRVRLEVHDTGCGIPADKQDAVFESFVQVDGSTGRRFQGTGLGLPISRHLAELMGGGITVRSEAGRGSVFTVTIELGKPEQAPAPCGGRPVARYEKNRSLQILLAEDNMVNQLFARKVLEKAGHHVFCVVSGAEALEALDRKPFDLVLMDVQMPKMDGIEATRAIRRSNKPWRSVPVIALTAHAMKGDREKFLRVGMNEYLSKPIDTARLHEVIRSLVREDRP